MKMRLNPVYALLPAVLLGGAVFLAPAHAEDEKAPEKDKKPAAEETDKTLNNKGEEEVLTVPAEVTADILRHSGEIVSQTGDLNIKVENQYYDEFPGYSLDHLTDGQRDFLLKRANSVSCPCGCQGDTVARCVVLDPTCGTARQMLDKILAQAGQLTKEELAAARAAMSAAAKAAAEKPPAAPPPSD